MRIFFSCIACFVQRRQRIQHRTPLTYSRHTLSLAHAPSLSLCLSLSLTFHLPPQILYYMYSNSLDCIDGGIFGMWKTGSYLLGKIFRLHCVYCIVYRVQLGYAHSFLFQFFKWFLFADSSCIEPYKLRMVACISAYVFDDVDNNMVVG